MANGDDGIVAAGPLSLRDLRGLTPARIALGRSGVSLPTQALLDFTLDHARARDAVHAPFDAEAMCAGLDGAGLDAVAVSSRAAVRGDYLRRPDLGRQLDAASRDRLAQRPKAPCDVVLVIADGLSPAAVRQHAAGLAREVCDRLAAAQLVIGPVVVATGGRVALGDEIGALVGARMVLVVIGERPGLTTPCSLGVYLTFGPRLGLTDADRNCVSNIHPAGLSAAVAADRIAWLARQGLLRGLTGVALKDDSGIATLPAVPAQQS